MCAAATELTVKNTGIHVTLGEITQKEITGYPGKTHLQAGRKQRTRKGDRRIIMSNFLDVLGAFHELR